MSGTETDEPEMKAIPGVETPGAVECLPYRGKPPGTFVPGADWRIWARRFENFLVLRKVSDEKEKRLIFLDEIGPEMYGVLEGLLPGKELEEVPYKDLKEKMETCFKPKVLLLSERYRLIKLRQKTDQSLSEFYAEIQRTAKTCQLEKVEDARDLLVSMAFLCGMTSDETRRRAMEQSERSAAELLEIAEAYERASRGAHEVRHAEGVHRVHTRPVVARRHDKKSDEKHSWENIKCFACGKRGHKKDKCRKGETHNVHWQEEESSSSCY